MNQMMDISTIQEDNQLLQKITKYYCDNSIENNPKNVNNLMDFNIPIQQILPNDIVNSSNLKSDVDENGIKRKQFQNDLSLCEKLKKQKII
ncbi:unnamed protein product [Macrosiphum euphorbiae]|uniref:Uncharacterized protein n=1 Tax=Macrosiphum euphorbiae TaxID=13131 RepID=A0AAV0WZB3_9HEMI|nr:unnamed protein product [Macrosiphum euphorbiae]